jgi:radical SAM superfamily enzyme YgiQ (UPF0313 family)
MPDIVLTTLNAKYIHPALGLRYLLANLGDLRARARLLEFDLNQRPLDVAEALLRLRPSIIGFGVYIWNVVLATQVVAILKRLRPDVILILGGPEVSYEVEQQAISSLADYVITGEADLAFAALCRQLLAGQRRPDKVIAAAPPDLGQLVLPYDEYDAEDLAHRLVYVEASRGCPFRCEFCLSSLAPTVRQFPLPAFLASLDNLLGRGAQRFKFVDRTFNLDLTVCRTILEFFLERCRPGLFLHFEMVPDRFPRELLELAAKFPAGVLQFEVGIQTFNPEVAQRISRRQDYAKLEENLRFLREHTAVNLHADLIAGLPGETLQSFAAGFDQLVALRPQEIQVGILKRLRGAPIGRHDAAWTMIYSPVAPYEILQNQQLDFATLQRLRRLASFWELVGNSGNFIETTPLIWQTPARGGADKEGVPGKNAGSPFGAFMRLSDWLYGQVGRQHAIALPRLTEYLFSFLTEVASHAPKTVAETLRRDYERAGRRELPSSLRAWL